MHCSTYSALFVGNRKENVSYSVRSTLRSSHRSVGMDDILVPERVLNMKSYSVTSETQNRTSRERCHI